MHFESKDENWKDYYRMVAKFLFEANIFLKESNINEDRIKRKYDAYY